MQPPTHQVQYENLGHPVMTSGFLFPVKIQPLSYTRLHAQTHSCAPPFVTHRTEQGWDQLITFQICWFVPIILASWFQKVVNLKIITYNYFFSFEIVSNENSL